MKHLAPIAALLVLAALPPAPRAEAARPALPKGVAPCETCHGERGEGNRAENAPRLAAQSQAYLARQLASFADGRRNSAVMTPIAKQLDEKLRNQLAAYYAGQEAPSAEGGAGAKGERGRLLAVHGDNRLRVQACDNCHGPDGIGEPPGYPYLGGQQRDYLVAALKAWRDGSRKTDPTAQMPDIAKRLGDDDMAAVADYYSAMAAPGPAAFLMTRRTPAKAPAAAGPVGGEAGGPAGRVGSEQGSPTTGGSQGPGGGGASRGEGGR